MPEQALYGMLDAASSMGSLRCAVPDSVARDLNPRYEPRPYQESLCARVAEPAPGGGDGVGE
jgi:hypothetical protein